MDKSERSPTCSHCGCSDLHLGSQDVTYEGITIHNIRGWHCLCGNVVFLDSSELARAKAAYEEKLLWQAIERAMRK